MPLAPRAINRKPRVSDSLRRPRRLPRPRFFRRLMKRTSWTTPRPAPELSQWDITERKRAEAARIELLRKLTIAEEDERRRISREVHDGLGQEVTALVLGLRVLATHLPSGSLAQSALSELVATVGRIDREVRALAVQLRPPALDDLGLDAALTTYVEQWSMRTGVDASFRNVGLNGNRLAPEVETALYRVVQEALNNVAKHAAAPRVRVLLQRTDSEILAIVEDDGRGFDAKQLATASASSKLGLLGMRERMAYTGGSLCITSREGVGSTVRASVPLAMSNAGGFGMSPVSAQTPSEGKTEPQRQTEGEHGCR